MVSKVKMIIPAIAGGIVISIFAFIPLVNYLCCIYVPVGGLISAALLKMLGGKDEKLETNDGIIAGGLAGIVAALIYAVVMLLMVFVLGGVSLGFGALAALASRNLAPLLALGGMGLFYSILMLVVIFVMVLVYFLVYGAFGAIGGAIGSSLMYKKK